MVERPKPAVSTTRDDTPSGGRDVTCIEGKPDAERTFPKAGA
jgi:hypothetical protein